MFSWGSIVVLVLCANGYLSDAKFSYAERTSSQDYGYSSVKHVKSSRGVQRNIFVGGCASEPAAPVNGQIRCSTDSGCIATCDYEHKFPNGVTQLAITCADGKWNIYGTDWGSVPHCEPICMPECQNNGVCVAPHHCDCPDHFTGLQCQFENKPCLDFPPPVLNAYNKCNTKSCTVSCLKNFTFPDGTAVANLMCKNGNWEPTRNDWVSVPDCEPVCDPPCQNGGNCLPSNLCQCPQAFRGPQCQYSADACSVERMGFNGGYYCSTSGDNYSCSLNCPAGVEFEFPPAAAYVCSYDKGVFEPQPIPQCKFNENMNIVSLGATYNTYVHETNHTWSFQDIFSSLTREPSISHSSYDVYGVYNNHGNNMSLQPVIMNSLGTKTILIEEKRPEPKTCFTWGGTHYKSFDDTIFSFESDCSHILVQEARDSVFTIIVQNSPTCKTEGNCFRVIRLFVQGKEFTLSRNEAGFPEFRTTKKVLPIPVQLAGLRVEMSAHFTVVNLDSLGVTLKWDGGMMLQVDTLENMWNRTIGLCGNMNGDKGDEFLGKGEERMKSVVAFASSWQTENIGETCDEYPSTRHPCTLNPEVAKEAVEFCSRLLSDRRFHACTSTVDYSELDRACLWDYCSCNKADRKECACETMNAYVRQCAHKKVISLSGWRSNDTCPMTCNNGRVYMSCGPKTEASCWTDVKGKAEKSCEEGCFCPEGTLAHEGKCIYPEECPCKLRGKLFQPGTSVPKDCNTCTCSSGKWICTQTRCASRCAVVGDPHYTTFDGKHYDFMGKCRYYLMKGDNYSIEGENTPCLGAISESMNFVSHDSPSCTKAVTINVNGVSIKLKQNRQVLVNGDDFTQLPTIVYGVRIRLASSIFLVVNLPNGLEVWWDGITRVYINAPPEFYGKTTGLCGTFTANQKDDFLTPDQDIEQTAVAFANKWKTEESCVDIPEKESKHPCDLNPQRRATAEKYCSSLYSSVFSDCHWHVDPESFHKDCLYDMCACEMKLESCLCSTLAAYAKECAAAGVKLLWREQVAECKMHCPRDQVYQICGNSCTRSCADISSYEDCRQDCVEGCNCPEGHTLDSNGECIPIGQCPCTYAGLEFKPGHREVRPGLKSMELCTCAGGLWSCHEATEEDIKEYPPAADLQASCVASKNLEVTDCMPLEPRTCHNMHKPARQSPSVCKSGCVCKSGYVLDSVNGTCIGQESCPCHHGGQSYSEGSVIQNDCNTCQCSGSKWKCTDRTCAGVCTAWGDSHYKTFDGRIYDFQGVCDYVLVKSSLAKEESFDISIQNVPCGTTGVSCSKSISISVGGDRNPETITLTRGKEIPKGNYRRMAIRTAGLFVFVDVPDLGLVVQWDKGTRVYVRLDPKWKGRTKGLCGDYNDNSEDDFKTPSGGISEVSANLFGDSWKKDDYCPEPKDVRDPCEQHPARKLWSTQKCGVLKSHIFQSCHSEVNVEPYLHNCVFDTCGCDAGGDCECLCTALAAYAHECNTRGVPIKWRSQDLCPMQCDESCSNYSPCISTCPRETCDNLMILKDQSHLCAQDTCVEGCSFKTCPDNQVYLNESYTECVPRASCKPFCTEINGVSYYEGDSVESDDCQTCYCSRGKVICKGEACTPKPYTVPHEQPHKCLDGWSAWINQDPVIKGKKVTDIEPLPSILALTNAESSAVCSTNEMVDIKCRSVKRHLTPKQSGLDVECSLERGLYCKPMPHLPCIDFEISVLCRCSATTESSVTEATTLKTEECSVVQPYEPHPTDCSVFYQCAPGEDGNQLVEKTCGSNMYFNPQAQVCDWIFNVIAIRPECSAKTTEKIEVITGGKTDVNTTITKNKTIITQKVCKDGEIWSDCAMKCSRMCEYYRFVLVQQGQCKDRDCIAGCVALDQTECPRHQSLKDARTCVDTNDCPCMSHDGSVVIPGWVVKESECEICQCVHNYYTCDNSSCLSTTVHAETTTETLLTTTEEWQIPEPTTPKLDENVIIVTSTVSPPAVCDSKNFVPLIERSKGSVSFNASSIKSPYYAPENALLNAVASDSSAGSWEPEHVNTEQWFDIKFAKPEPIYGVTLQGSTVEDKFVTSYKILYSEDGYTFSYVLDKNRMPHTFRGPVDNWKPVEQIFLVPVEARVIRINPQTWHNGIAMKVEVLGCQETTSTSTTEKTEATSPVTEKTITPVCSDPMGVDDGVMADQQISASSSLTNLIPNIRLTSPGVWRPKLDNPHQFVQFDFLDTTTLTGVTTKGGDGTWTTVYKVFYSQDGDHWNPVVNRQGLAEEFLGNFDAETLHTNYFDKPVDARYLRVQPEKWHGHVGLKVEVQGCFVPYPHVIVTTEGRSQTPSSTTPRTVLEECNVCEGVSVENEISCRCEKPYWWNGNTCGTQQECPCVVGHVPYNVGAVYETEDCQQCVCTLGGVSTCSPKICEPCTLPNMQSVTTELCSCLCRPCPEGTRLCPTGNVCVNETLWCNGIQDCPDDEIDCPKATTPKFEEVRNKTTTTSPPPVVQVCQEPICPPGYKTAVLSSVKSYHPPRKGGVKTLRKSFTKTKHIRPQQYNVVNGPSWNSTICPEFTCVPYKPPVDNQGKVKPCPKVACPPDYTVVYEKISTKTMRKCPKYTCKPPPPQEAICNVTGRTFNTFDHLEYKYDICNHILARDMFENKWYITLEKQCDSKGSCMKILAVTIDNTFVVLYPDMHVDINEYSLTRNQIARLGDKFASFKISNIGDANYLVSIRYGFWAIFDSDSNIKIGVPVSLSRQVDGLCGYFDGRKENDRQTPDGTQARSTIEFANSWAMDEAPECNPQVCPYDIQAEAWKICNLVKDQSLSDCSGIVDLEKFVSRCVENTCTCLRSNQTYDDCRCRLLTNFVTECQAGDLSVDLSSWRTAHDCPASCPSPLVHKDCFRNKCERNCDNLQDVEPCPVMQGVCFSGCFCPEGTVRDGNDCVPPTHCRDCTCEWLGNSKFITFDRKNVPFDRNCTFVLSRDIIGPEKNSQHTYQVFVTNGYCDEGTCTEAVTIVFNDHVVQMRQNSVQKEFEVAVDDSRVEILPYNSSWLILDQSSSKDLKLLIPAIQLEITSFQPNFAFTLTLPSHTLGGSMEGLCGDCNEDPEDDMRTQSGEVTTDSKVFGESWLAERSPQGVELDWKSCTVPHRPDCVLPPDEQNPCRVLSSSAEFEACHNLVDPTPYVTACQDTICTGASYCDSFEAYARKCQQAGVCLTWRSPEICPYECPPHLEYQACSSPCKRTCDSLSKVDELSCSVHFVEGCFCPQDRVLHNDTCIPWEKCFVCDNEGHVEGDTWYPDVCTKCTCSKEVVSCEKTECPAIDTICEENMTPSLINGTENDCCPKYLCVPEPVTTTMPLCTEEAQKPECGFGQVMKLSRDANGCRKFICECVPVEECPPLNEVNIEVEDVESAMTNVMNTSGCCPRLESVCDPNHCPPIPTCPNYYQVKTEHGQCCANYECVPPKDLCLYSLGSGNSIDRDVFAKKVGEEWSDGPCVTCDCQSSEEGPKSVCVTKECINMQLHPDINDFVLEEVLLPDKCCPSFERSACKYGNKIYKVGESWQPNDEDSCVRMECIRDVDGVQKQTTVQKCTEFCDPGYEYRSSIDQSVECCGKCVPVACVVGTDVKKVGDTWLSDDYCTMFSCQSVNGSVFVHSVSERCPPMNIDEDEFQVDEQVITGQCCSEFVRTGCKYNGQIYKPGEKWRLAEDSCVTESCVLQGNVTKQREVETCTKDCVPGWMYEEPRQGECCGKCRQVYCIVGDMLYEPGMTWSSPDKCTTYSCLDQGEQLSISSSSMACPDVSNCPPERIYMKDCCKQCNVTADNQKKELCIAEVLDGFETVAMFSIHHRVHGFCKNFVPVDGITKCRGKCESTSYFDSETWSPAVDCQCCQPREYITRSVTLQCEDRYELKKVVSVPVSCSCEPCGSESFTKNRPEDFIKH